MPRPKLNKVTVKIEVNMTPEDKQALQKWCEVNGITMGDVIRSEISHIVTQGHSLMNKNSN